MQWVTVKLGDTVVQQYPIEQDVISIGRARDNEIVIENLSVSRNHARIRREDDGSFALADLNSANGSFVNGVKISGKQPLANGDLISIGKHKLQFHDEEGVEWNQGPSKTPAQALPSTPAPQRVPATQGGSGTSTPFAPPAVATGSGSGIAVPEQVPAGKVAALLVARGRQEGTMFRVGDGETRIGRSNENEIRIQDPLVSRRHASISFSDHSFAFSDLGSWRGTTINGHKRNEAQLRQGDEILLGSTMLVFQYVAEDELNKSDSFNVLQADEVSEFQGSTGMIHSADIKAEQAERLTQDSIPVADGSSVPVSPSLETADSAELAGGGEDEFAPMTEDELAELEEMELDADMSMSGGDEEMARQAEFEQKEAERLMEEGGGMLKAGVLMDDPVEQARDEDASIQLPDEHDLVLDEKLSEDVEVDAEDAEVEENLFGGPVTNEEPNQQKETDLAGAQGKSPIASSKAAGDSSPPDGVDPKEFRRWMRGLKNKSKIVRKEAARKLKELTGNEYDWESDPE